MMRASRLILVPLILGAAVSSARAQGLPTSQPGRLTIYQEEVKVGRGADHAVNEAGWPAAFEKANSPYHYLALDAMTGPSEVWFVVAYESYAKEADDMHRNESDPVLAAELERLRRADAEYLNNARSVQAVARPDLSYGGFPDVAKARFYDITTFRVRPGHEQGFDSAAKTYAAIAKRVAPQISFRTYMVTGGLPGPTFLVFTSVNSYAEFDQTLATDMKIGEGMTAEETALFTKFSTEGLINVETNRYRVDPRMSYVDKATRAQDPAFWGPKQ
jgi:hypothetical protein